MKLKKFVSLLTSLACTNLLLMPLSTNAALPSEESANASATNYNSCDVDRNSTVNILDAIALNNALLGK